MGIKGLDHVNINTSNMKGTMSFYTDLLDFTDGFRPPFDFPGAWLYAGGNAVIHLVFSDSEPNVISNPVDHIAFEATGFEETNGFCQYDTIIHIFKKFRKFVYSKEV